MRIFLPAVFLTASFAAAQTTSTAGADKKKIRLEGRVLSLTGDVVRKATLRLQSSGGVQNGQPPTNYSESSGNDGKFVFEDVAPGRYTLTAEKAGYVTQSYGARSNSSPGTLLTLNEGDQMKDLSIKMTPQGVVTGRITDQDGDPITGAQVSMMRFNYIRGRKQLSNANTATTNDQGDFRISNLVPGRYYLSASDRRQLAVNITERPGRATNQESNVTTYYPNGLDASGAAPLDVAAGAELRGIDIRMLRAKVYSVQGKVFDSSTVKPAPSGVLMALSSQDQSPLLAITQTIQVRPDGSFELRNLLPGSYVLRTMPGVILNGSPMANLTGHLDFTVADSNLDNVVIVLSPGLEISGTVKLEDGNLQDLIKRPATPTPTGVAAPAPPPIRVSLVGAETLLLVGSSSAQVASDGTFKLPSAGAGKYWVNVNGFPEGTYVKMLRFGGQDITHLPLDLSSGAGGTLDIVLSSKAGDVSGGVQNEKGEALAGGMVTLWPKSPDLGSSTGGVRQAFTDQNGGFKLTGLAAGDYLLA